TNVTDYLIWYCKNIDLVKYRELFTEKVISGEDAGTYRFLETEDGARRPLTSQERTGMDRRPTGSRLVQLGDLTSAQAYSSGTYAYSVGRGVYRPPLGRAWSTVEKGMNRLKYAKRIHESSASLRYVRYHDDFPVARLANVWTDTGVGQYTEPKAYVVQTGN